MKKILEKLKEIKKSISYYENRNKKRKKLKKLKKKIYLKSLMNLIKII
ncbi:hypothetical protein [Fusobacterium polymorphum]